MTTQSERIESVANEVRDTLLRKNHDYGDSFAKQYVKYGLMSGLIRMDDKMSRLETLRKSETSAQVDESIEDTLLDLAGYAMLTVMELRKGNEKDTESETLGFDELNAKLEQLRKDEAELSVLEATYERSVYVQSQLQRVRREITAVERALKEGGN